MDEEITSRNDEHKSDDQSTSVGGRVVVKRPRPKRGRRFTWTAFPHLTTDDEFKSERLDVMRRLLDKGCGYAIIGLEKCGTTGRIHLQGYSEFPTPRSFDIVKKIIGHGAHIAGSKGTGEENRVYCSKDGDFIEEGVMSVGQGHRSDLDYIRVKLLLRYFELINK